jgi:hypothetical protein
MNFPTQVGCLILLSVLHENQIARSPKAGVRARTPAFGLLLFRDLLIIGINTFAKEQRWQISQMSFVNLVLLACCMTFHAILEIGDVFIQMPFHDLCLIVLVAAITGIGCKTGWMTCCACGSTTMIQRKCMLTMEFRRSPGSGVMAYGTFRSK